MRTRNEALEWLQFNDDGYPRSWRQEAMDTARRGYDAFEDDCPPIAGYEALEREGFAERLGLVNSVGVERVHFHLKKEQRMLDAATKIEIVYDEKTKQHGLKLFGGKSSVTFWGDKKSLHDTLQAAVDMLDDDVPDVREI